MRVLTVLVLVVALALVACGKDGPNAWTSERGCQDAEDIAACMNSCDALASGLEYLEEREPPREADGWIGWSWAWLAWYEDGEAAGCWP